MYYLDTMFPAVTRRFRLPLSRDQLMLLMAAINEIFLGIDIYLAHNINGTITAKRMDPDHLRAGCGDHAAAGRPAGAAQPPAGDRVRHDRLHRQHRRRPARRLLPPGAGFPAECAARAAGFNGSARLGAADPGTPDLLPGRAAGDQCGLGGRPAGQRHAGAVRQAPAAPALQQDPGLLLHG